MKERVVFFLNERTRSRLEDHADMLGMSRSDCLEIMIERALESDSFEEVSEDEMVNELVDLATEKLVKLLGPEMVTEFLNPGPQAKEVAV
jgi:hypothetical protein